MRYVTPQCGSALSSGDSIAPKFLPKLTHSLFTTKVSGNGLGWAITKRIVEAHQGQLTIIAAVTIILPQVSLVLGKLALCDRVNDLG